MNEVTLFTDDGPDSLEAVRLLEKFGIPFKEWRKDRDIGFDDEWVFPTINADVEIFHNQGLYWVKRYIAKVKNIPIEQVE